MLDFAYPWFLLGLSLLALPVLLHLMNREIPRRQVFPAIRFIRRAKLPREGKRRLQDLLLLLLRLGAMAAIVLAFARPRLVRPPAVPTASGPTDTRIVFLLDASASMATVGAWPAALAELEGQLDTLPPGDATGLIISSDIITLTLPVGTDRQTILAQARAHPPRPMAGNHAMAVAEAGRLLGVEGARRLVVISDLQVGDWQMTRPTLPAGVTVRLMNPLPIAPANVALIDTTVAATGPGSRRVVVELRNFADSPQERTVTVRVGAAARSQAVALPPLQVRRLAFSFDNDDAVKGLAQLSADDYAFDDTFYFWAGARPPLPVVTVVPDSESDRGSDAQTFFLRNALAGTIAGQPTYQVRSVPADAFFVLDLGSVPIVFFLGTIELLDDAGFEHLRDYVRGGGTAVCVPGKMPAHMFHGLRVNGLFDARFTDAARHDRRQGESLGLGWVNPEGILGQAFADAESTDLFLFPIRTLSRFEPGPNSIVHLKTLTGEPVLAEQAGDRGRVLVSALAFDTAASDLPLTTSFLPLVRELVQAATGPDSGIARLECGQPPPERPDLLGKPHVAAVAEAFPTDAPGTFLFGDLPTQINVSRRESSPERVNTYDLTRQLVGTVADAVTPAATPEDSGEMTALWPLLAVAAAMFLLLEMGYTAVSDHREVVDRLGA